MGYRVGDRCYDSQAEAGAVFYSSQSPVTLHNKGEVFFITFYPDESGVKVFKSDLLGSSQLAFYPYSFPVCTVSGGVSDGLTLGFAVVGVWIAAYCVRVLKEALK